MKEKKMSDKQSNRQSSRRFYTIIVLDTVLFTLFLFLLFLIYWTEDRFGVGLSIHQILNNIFSPNAGMDSGLMRSLNKRIICAVLSGGLFFFILSGFSECLIRRFFFRSSLAARSGIRVDENRTVNEKNVMDSAGSADSGQEEETKREIIVPSYYGRNKITGAILTIAVFLTVFILGEKKFRIIDYIVYGAQETTAFDGYRVPVETEIIAPAQKRNFVWVLSESFEESYSESSIFGEDLISELSALKSQGESIPNWIQVDGTGWTIAALVSSLYGIPRRYVWNGQTFSKNSMVKVLRGARSIFHIFHEQGYEIVFVQGDSLAFAGRNFLFENFPWMKCLSYEDLSKTEVFQDFLKHNERYVWGVHDFLVFASARKEYERLSSSGRPYVLVVQLLDTHGTRGFLVPEAERKYGDFRDVVREQSRMIASFTKTVQSGPGNEKTAILLMGDHLVMRNTIQKLLNRVPKRKVFNLWLNGDPSLGPMSTSPCTTFDFAPSILEFVGFRWQDRQFGVGISCFSDQQRMLEKYTPQEYQVEINKESKVYDRIMLRTEQEQE